MGIEYIAKRVSAYRNQRFATAAQPCVRFLREKRRHTSQRQPISATRVRRCGRAHHCSANTSLIPVAACVDATVNETPQ